MPKHRHLSRQQLSQLADKWVEAGFPMPFPTAGDWQQLGDCPECKVTIQLIGNLRASGHLTGKEIKQLVDNPAGPMTNQARHVFVCLSCQKRRQAEEEREFEESLEISKPKKRSHN